MLQKKPFHHAILVFSWCIAIAGTVLAHGRTQFTFALVSDTHVGSATGEEDLRRTVRDLNERNDVAFVIISGDIAEMGSNAQLTLAKSILDNLREPYHIIPGNHDAKWSESGCTEFSRLWGSDRFSFDFDGYRFVGCGSGPNMRMGDGHIPPEDIRWVDSALTHMENPREPVIFVNHYPLDSQLDNSYVILNVLRKHNIQAILCGHGHADKALSFDGIPATMGRSNLRAAKPVGGYNLVDLRNDSLIFSERIPGVETKLPWRYVELHAPVERSASTAPAMPEYSVNAQFPDVRVKWSVETGYSIGSTAAVWDDLTFVGTSEGVMAAYSVDDGSVQWTYKTGGSIYSSPEVDSGKLVFGSSDGKIYCLAAQSGKLLWAVQTAAPVVACPAIQNGKVFIGATDSVFRAIDLVSGKLIWSYRELQGFVETRPLLYEGKVIFGAWDTYLYALDERTGALVWRWTNGNPGRLFSPAACWPVASAGKVFIVAPDRIMTALDAATGKVVWRSGLHQVREMIGISQDSSRVYVRLMNDSLLAFSATSNQPLLQWATDCRYGYDIDPSMPVEYDGHVLFGTKNGLIFSVEATTGDIQWEHKLGNTIVNTLTPLSGGRLVATTMDGVVALLQSQNDRYSP